MARILRSLVTIVDGREDKSTSAVVAASSKHTAGLVSIWNRLSQGQSPLAALAGGIGLTGDQLSQEYRNNGIDPTRLNAEMEAWMRENGVPDNAAEGNEMLALAEDESRGGVIPTWGLVGLGLAGLFVLGGFGSRGRRRGRRSFRSFRMPRFRSRPFRRARHRRRR